MTNTSHLVALLSRLANERAAFNRATKPSELALRAVWIKQIEKEINGEERFLGMEETDFNAPELTDEELRAELADW